MFFSGRVIKYLICLLVVLCSLILIKNAYVQPPPPSVPTYTWSAHGNASYGVNRSSLSTSGYSIGNCAHCHEQHASIGGAEPEPNTGDDAGPDIYLLYKMLWGTGNPQAYEFCYGCHIGTGSCQLGTGTCQSIWGRTPDFALYSYRAGGDTSINCLGAPYSVYDSFRFVTNAGASRQNCGSNIGSSHMLRNIRDYLSGQWNFSSTNTEVNPCSGCHNPHRAQRDPHTTTGRFVGQKLFSAVSLPLDHSKDNNAWKLWGDDLGERMSDYTTNYQAPFRSGSTTTYEPDGWNTSDASRTFNTVTFCLGCHQNNLPSTRIAALSDAPPRQVAGRTNIINWDATGDQHGQRLGDGYGAYPVLAPYTQGDAFNYVLSCLDCHEPHGSPNAFLLRQEVNGKGGIVSQTGIEGDFCGACHTLPHGTVGCGWCHYHGNSSTF